MFATLGCLFLTVVHVSNEISFWWCVLSFLCWHLDDWSGFILWMNSRSFGALRQRCRSLSGERRRKTVSLKRLFYKQISDFVWCQYKLAIYWYKERGILTADAFPLLAPPRVNLNHSYSKTIIGFFNHPERRASFVFVLYRFPSMSLMKDPVGGGFVWMPHSCSLFSDEARICNY